MTRRRAISFTEFVAKIGLRLTAGQAVLARVAFDGADPAGLPPDEREIAGRIFGPSVDVIRPLARTVIAAVLGARSGKSVIGAARCLHAALTCPIDRLGPGEVGYVLLLAPDLRLSRATLNYCRGFIHQVPALKRLLVSETGDRLTLKRERRQVSIEALPAARGGSSARGRSLLGALMDESAFFKDERFQVCDVAVYQAIAPRLLPGAQLLLTSTPWSQSGMIYDLWRSNFDRPTTSLVAHASTSTMRGDDPNIAAMIERERQRDESNWRREFCAEFLPGTAGAVFDSESINACVRPGPASLPADPSRSAWAAIDLGFANDASALAIVRQADGDFLEVCDLTEWHSSPGAPLLPGELLAGRVLPRLRAHGAHVLAADGHYIAAVREHLGGAVRIVPVGTDAAGKAEMYRRAQEAIHAQRVRLPDHASLLRQLHEVTSRPLPGGAVRIESPHRPGSHGDLVSALVGAIYLARGVRSGSSSLGVGVGRRREGLTVLGIRDEGPTFSVSPDGRISFGGVRGGGGWSSGGY